MIVCLRVCVFVFYLILLDIMRNRRHYPPNKIGLKPEKRINGIFTKFVQKMDHSLHLRFHTAFLGNREIEPWTRFHFGFIFWNMMELIRA